MTDLVERLRARGGPTDLEAADKIASLRSQLAKAKLALEECCHMAGAHTETDAEDWLASIRQYASNQLDALTDDKEN